MNNLLSSPLQMKEKMNQTVSYDLAQVLSDQAGTKAKATSSKRRALSRSVSGKLQKLDLSLEAYVHVLLSVQHHLNFSCSLENLRKVLLANNLSPKTATKEFITAHLHELHLFKPFFSSVGSLNNKNLLVNPIGIKHADLVEDLNTLEWLEYGGVLVEADAQSLLGTSVKNASSSAGCPLPKAPDCRHKSQVRNPYPAFGDNGLNITENFSHKSHVFSLQSRPMPCPRSAMAKVHLPLYNSLPKTAQNNDYEPDQYVIDLDPGLSTADSSFTSAVTNPCVPFCNSQQKNMEKVASELVSMIDVYPPAQCATLARVVEAEADRSPCLSLPIMNSGTNVSLSKACHEQLDVMNNSFSLIVQDENVCPAGELALFQLNRNEGQNTSSSTLQLQSRDMPRDSLEQLVSTQNFYRKEGENAIIDSSSQDGKAHGIMQLSSQRVMNRNEEESIFSNRSTLVVARHDLTQPVYPQNLNREEPANIFSSISSQPPSQSNKAVHELVQLACPQPLHRKEEENTTRRASQPGMPILDRVTPTCSIMTEATNVFVISPSDQPNAAAHDPAQLVSPKNSGHTGGSCLPDQEASLTPAPQMELNSDVASAGFWDVLSDSVASMPAGREALSACNENSLNLLERWEKRRQKSSEVRGRMKTKMQEEKGGRCKRVHLQQESGRGRGNGSSFYSQAAIAERCSSLREEASKLMSE